jgi:hypothetical protein
MATDVTDGCSEITSELERSMDRRFADSQRPLFILCRGTFSRRKKTLPRRSADWNSGIPGSYGGFELLGWLGGSGGYGWGGLGKVNLSAHWLLA